MLEESKAQTEVKVTLKETGGGYKTVVCSTAVITNVRFNDDDTLYIAYLFVICLICVII